MECVFVCMCVRVWREACGRNIPFDTQTDIYSQAKGVTWKHASKQIKALPQTENDRDESNVTLTGFSRMYVECIKNVTAMKKFNFQTQSHSNISPQRMGLKFPFSIDDISQHKSLIASTSQWNNWSFLGPFRLVSSSMYLKHKPRQCFLRKTTQCGDKNTIYHFKPTRAELPQILKKKKNSGEVFNVLLLNVTVTHFHCLYIDWWVMSWGVLRYSPMKKVSGALSPLSRDTVSGSKRSHSPTARTKDPINWWEIRQKDIKLAMFISEGKKA